MPVDYDVEFLQKAPVFHRLSSDDLVTILDIATQKKLPAGETLFIEGEIADKLYVHLSGGCILSQNAVPIAEAKRGQVLDLIPVLGGLPHEIRAITRTECLFLCWNVADLLQLATFTTALRRFLAENLRRTSQRLTELETPINYADLPRAGLSNGPFVFDNTTLVMAFCDADLDFVRPLLPEGVSLFRPVWRKRDGVMLAMAHFRDAHPDHRPGAIFSYTETTCFLPVRVGRKFGLYPQFIYPSTWEPILLGREIYGFPKRLGHTVFDGTTMTLAVDGIDHFSINYGASEATTEPRLIRAMSDWLGIEGRVTEAAFRLGDTLLDVMRTPLYRRISAYNHKQVLSAKSTVSTPHYDIDQLTQAIFSVMKWHRIEKLTEPHLSVSGGPLAQANVTLREAYYTQLDMRLSTGRIVRDYNIPS